MITRGWADPQNAASLTGLQRYTSPVQGTPLVPGQFRDLIFHLEPDDQIIPPGSRIGLMIFGSDRDHTLWPAPGTGLSIDLAATSLILPIVSGAAALR